MSSPTSSSALTSPNDVTHSLPATRYPPLLIAYFQSGWAFFIPYLAVYLLYAWLKWPVNTGAGEGSTENGAGGGVPCLLHVYWALHAIHLILGAIALRSWWKESTLNLQLSSSTGALSASSSGLRPLTSVLWPLLPWLCLALIFWIPGIYLEWPSDPWEHLRRINEWWWLHVVTEHSTWTKSGHFLAYSLIGSISPPSQQLESFDAYYVCCCLLLCWQYYRLARIVGLNERTSFIFVLLQAMVFGNNLFGFYRYYGLSSSVFAQLGAIALTRTALETMQWWMARRRSVEKAARPAPVAGEIADSTAVHPPALFRSGFLEPVLAAFALLVLIVFQHRQGLGIAGLGIAAVAIWRLAEWRRSTLGWLALLALVLSLAVIKWYPRNDQLDSALLQAGWLAPWYGFNLFSPASPAFDRAAAILAFVGALNLLAALWLLRRNHVAGWLAVVPVALLCLPCVSIPFASVLAMDQSSGPGDNILVFHRVLLAIPPGLALAVLGAEQALPYFSRRTGWGAFAFLLAAVAALIVLPANRPWYNRLFNVLLVPSRDLAMRHVIESSTVGALTRNARQRDSDPELKFQRRGSLLATPGISYVLNSTGQTLIANAQRFTGQSLVSPPSLTTSATLEGLGHVDSSGITRGVFRPNQSLASPLSMSGYISGHWLPDAVALAHANQEELLSIPRHLVANVARRAPQIWVEWARAGDSYQPGPEGSGQPLTDPGPQERGGLGGEGSGLLFRPSDRLSLRPFFRTPDGNGHQITLAVDGPGYSVSKTFAGTPSPLGGIGYVTGTLQIQLPNPGDYVVELTGTTLWPMQTHAVRYHVIVHPD